MATKRHKPEEIVTKLRQVEVPVGQGMARVPFSHRGDFAVHTIMRLPVQPRFRRDLAVAPCRQGRSPRPAARGRDHLSIPDADAVELPESVRPGT